MFLLGTIWGGAFLSVRIALDEVGVIQSAAHRVLWAAIALWIVVLLRKLPLPKDARTWGALVLMGVLNNVIPFSLLAWGQLHIETDAQIGSRKQRLDAADSEDFDPLEMDRYSRLQQ